MQIGGVFSALFFYLFPFNVVFNENMVIVAVGASLKTIMDDVQGKAVDEAFALKKPPISFTYNNVFETINPVSNLNPINHHQMVIL